MLGAFQAGEGEPATPVAEEAARGESLIGQAIERLFGESTLGPWAQALILFVGGLVLARLANWLVTRLARRAAERTKLTIDDQLVESMQGPLVRSLVILAMAAAIQPLDLPSAFGPGLESILVSLAILSWVPWAFGSSSLVLRAASQDEQHFRHVEPRTFPLFDNLVKVVLFVGFAYVVLCEVWDLDPAGFLASAGVIGIAIGFAAQDTLSNLFAGVFIIADAPYRVGDFITLDTGERGEVLHIGLRSTRILTRDDIEITIPNSVMGRAKITNEAGGPTPMHRIRVPVSVAYGSDVDLVRSLLIEVAADEENVVQAPEPRVRFRSFGESGLEFELLCWIPEPVLRGQTLDRLHTQTYKRFQTAKIEIPYPKRDVFLHRASPDVGPG